MPNLVEICPVVLEKIFLNFVNVFLLFRNDIPLEKSGDLHLVEISSMLSHLEKGEDLHLNKLNPLHPRMVCSEFGRNWPSGSWEDDF